MGCCSVVSLVAVGEGVGSLWDDPESVVVLNGLPLVTKGLLSGGNTGLGVLDVLINTEVWHGIASCIWGLELWVPLVVKFFLGISDMLLSFLDIVILSEVWHEIVHWVRSWHGWSPGKKWLSLD